MEALFVLLIGGLILFWMVAPFVLFGNMRLLRERVERLEREIEDLRGGPAAAAETWHAPWAAPAPEAVAPESGPEPAPPPPKPEPVPEPEPAWEPTQPDEERETLGGLFERFVAGKLLVWLGGIALFTAAFFLIRYSIEIGLVTPAMRMIAAAVFGFVLLGASEYARSGRLFSDDQRVAQALAGAGLVTLYATAYASHLLYGLIGTGTAIAAMAAVSAAALALALRHGAPTAVMGLVGGFLTPALVGNPDAGAVPLLVYLGLLDLAVFLIAWRRGWTWLAAAAVVLSYVWTVWVLAQPPDDALAGGVFVILLALAASLLRPGRGRELALIQPLAIALVLLSALVGRTDLGPEGWILYGLLAAASLALAALRREHRFAPPLAVALALFLLLIKANSGHDPLVPAAAAGIAAIFGLGGLALTAWRGGLLWTAVACAGFAGPAPIVRAVRPELLERPGWGALMLALALGPAFLVWLNRRRAGAEPPADLALFAAGAAASALLGAAVWDLLPHSLAAAGWLAVALAVAMAARRLGDLALAIVAVLAAGIGVARALWTVPELSASAMTALIGLPVLARDLPTALDALHALALPALLLAALRLALPAVPLGARKALPIAAGAFAVAALYVGYKQAFGLAGHDDFAARGMLERTLLTQALFLVGWGLGSGRLRVPRLEPDLVRLAGTAVTAFAAARLIWFDLFFHNPAWADQWVGTVPVLNLILPAYLMSAVWLYLARRRADQATRSGFWLAAFLAALVAGTMLLVRQGFQGPILTGADMPIAEFYTYSLAGLAVSIGLIVAGMRLPDKALRLAGLVLLTATIVKVFLVDASELEGVWRILSFLGLGVALIGIGRLYGPVLRAERPAGEERASTSSARTAEG